MYKSTEEYINKVLLPMSVGESVRVSLRTTSCSPERFRVLINYLNYITSDRYFRTMELTSNVIIVGVSQARSKPANKIKQIVVDKIKNMQLNEKQYLTIDNPNKYRLAVSYMSRILGIKIKTKTLSYNELLLERTE